MKFKFFYIILFLILSPIQSYADISYSTIGNPKALGLDISLFYPDDWGKMKINTPNVVEYIQKSEGDAVLGITIAVTAIPKEEFDKDEVMAMFNEDDYPESCAQLYYAQLISFKRYTKDGLNYLRLFLKREDASGIEVYQITTICFLENYCIEIASVATSLTKNISSLNLYSKNEALLLKISDSIKVNKNVVPELKNIDYYTAYDYSSDYEEFSANVVSIFDSSEYKKDEFSSFTFKYPKSWALQKAQKSTQIGLLFSPRASSNYRKVFLTSRFMYGKNDIKNMPEIFNSLEKTKSFLEKSFGDVGNLEYIYIDGIKSISFTISGKSGDFNILTKQTLVPLGGCAICFSISYLSMETGESIINELNEDKKLFEAIFDTITFKNKELLKYQKEISQAYLNREENSIKEEKLSSLKEGEGLVVSIPEICSFQIPYTMEAQDDYYEKLHNGFLEIAKIENEFEMIFQQKGLNTFKNEALDGYCRIFVKIEKSEDVSISIHDPLPLTNSDLEEIYLEIKKEHKEANGMMILDKPMKILSIKKPRVKRINNIDCLYIELERQLGDNPEMLRCSYTFFNYDREITFSTNYRIKDKDKWEKQIETFLNSIKFYDRKESANNIPKHAMHISGEKIDGHLYIPVKISGNIGKLETLLMFDSGATISMLPESVFYTISTMTSKSSTDFDTASGSYKMNMSMLTLETGNIKKKIEFAVSPKASMGVIGLNFFEGYKYIVNMENSKIYFWK